MKAFRARAIARKEFIHILRDPRSLGMAIAIPMLLLILFGFALTLDVDRVPIVVWDQDGSPHSREFISRFEGSRYFRIHAHVRNYRDVERAVDTGNALAAIVIPADFGGRITTGRDTPVQMIVDGSDANTATIALGYARATTLRFSQQAVLQATRRAGAAALTAPVELRPRVWYNPDLKSRNYIIPGLIAVIMMVIAAMLTSLTVAREWERGTMEQLIATPVRGSELILGKMLPYFAIGMLDVLLAVLMAEFVFQVPLRGSPALLFGMAAVFLAGALSLGMLISIATRNQLLASQLAIVLTFLPSFLLSGFMYAIGNMPRPIQIATHLIPARYFVSLLKGIYLKGIGLEIMAAEAALLTVFGAGVMLVATKKFRKKIAP
jgi:ABC-2 type transport system permease protein